MGARERPAVSAVTGARERPAVSAVTGARERHAVSAVTGARARQAETPCPSARAAAGTPRTTFGGYRGPTRGVMDAYGERRGPSGRCGVAGAPGSARARGGGPP